MVQKLLKQRAGMNCRSWSPDHRLRSSQKAPIVADETREVLVSQQGLMMKRDD